MNITTDQERAKMSTSPQTTAIILSNDQGRIVFWNSVATMLFGFDEHEAVGESVELVIPPDYVAPHWDGFRRAMQSGECKIDGAAFHLPVKCKEGAVRMFPARFVFLRDACGKAAGAMVLFSKHSESAQPFSPIVTGADATGAQATA